MAHGVHPVVDGVQPARPQSQPDRAPFEAKRAQLVRGDDAVLSPRELRDRAIASGVQNDTVTMLICTHDDEEAHAGALSPPAAPSER